MSLLSSHSLLLMLTYVYYATLFILLFFHIPATFSISPSSCSTCCICAPFDRHLILCPSLTSFCLSSPLFLVFILYHPFILPVSPIQPISPIHAIWTPFSSLLLDLMLTVHFNKHSVSYHSMQSSEMATMSFLFTLKIFSVAGKGCQRNTWLPHQIKGINLENRSVPLEEWMRGQVISTCIRRGLGRQGMI